jgi:N-methylhydantoinase A
MENPARVVNLRSVHRAASGEDIAARPYAPSGKPQQKANRWIFVGGGSQRVAATVWDRMALPPHASIDGPAIIEQSDTTTLVPLGWAATVNGDGSIIMTWETGA